MKTASYATALNDIDAIKISVATSITPVTYITSGINGVIGLAAMSPARTLTITTSAQAAAYTLASTITITGVDAAGRSLSEVFTIGNANGGETLVGTKGFAGVLSIVVAAQASALGAFSFGVRDILCDKAPYMIRANGAGDLHVAFSDASEDTIPAMAAKEYITFAPVKVFGDSGTTITGLTLFFK
jgi:hypothetical protein